MNSEMISSEEQALLAKWKRTAKAKVLLGGFLILSAVPMYMVGRRMVFERGVGYATSRALEAKHRLAQLETTTDLDRTLIDRLNRSADSFLESMARTAGLAVGLVISGIVVIGEVLLIFGLGERRRIAQLEKLRRVNG